ncbi:helix-turn-helix domain-containing protein [Glaciecola sp. MH2013]|uniref:helix-turn-helix domain-containing protein n=1 Tax=Glaciecola sp. MH2013 TaxID=2785524 RepID=UPI00189FF8C2|nr:helix-turn-helix domain-containing protein [Glaciecola sp. MH2013]MBF7074922.1 helix-turn-helix domain-containing protein [Glaciecola sp. MH2013]
MSQKIALLNTLKKLLKTQGFTYKKVAMHLDLSEAAIKRMFANNDFSLSRLESLCTLLGIEISDLTTIMLEDKPLTERLSLEQESSLISNTKLLMLSHLLMSHWSCSDVIAQYDYSEHELTRCLAQLDKMKIIDLLPGNRVKLKVSRDFKWIENGPIEQFYKQHVQSDFFRSKFTANSEIRLFLSGMLSKASSADLINRIERLGSAFNTALDKDQVVDFDDKFGTALVVAMRPWTLAIFEQYRKKN